MKNYTESQARELVIEAGHRLVDSGLIARTWGNVSARISDTQFIITPSGRSYDTLRPEELVRVNIADCSYEGSIKPSSEKGVHADGYALRPGVGFIIHTHQFYATAVGVEGKSVAGIPCAAYGIPSTKRLRRAVAEAVGANPAAGAVLMMRHGALCLGADHEDAFNIASELEERCQTVYDGRVAVHDAAPILRLGSSARRDGGFELALDGVKTYYPIGGSPTGAPPAARLHEAVYAAGKAQCIVGCGDGEVVEISRRGRKLHPVVDDLAQIAGVTLRCVEPEARAVAAALRGRDAVLIRGCGALCVGLSYEDAQAVSMILRKDCAAALYTGSLGGMSAADALVQRLVYVNKYSKKKDGA